MSQNEGKSSQSPHLKILTTAQTKFECLKMKKSLPKVRTISYLRTKKGADFRKILC